MLDSINSRRDWLLLGGLALFLLVLSVSYYRKVTDEPRSCRSAIYRWQNQLRELADGRDIWEAHHYPNPPIMALLLMPLAHLPSHLGAMIWFYAKSMLTLLSLYWIFRMLERDGPPVPFMGKALALFLGLRLLAGDLTHGNVNLFIFFLVVAFLYAFLHRHDFKAGLLLALAIACKVTPALFLPYLAWKRAWRTLAGTAVGLILFFLVAPGMFLGMSRNVLCLQSWADAMVRPYVIDGKVTTEYANQSLLGLVHRLASRRPSFIVETIDGVVPVAYHNVIDMEPQALAWITRGLGVLFAGVVVWSCRHPIAERESPMLLAEAGVVVLGMLLLSERTWKHHCVTMLIPFAVLSYTLFVRRPGQPLRRYIIGTLIAVFLLMTATSSGLFPGHDRLGRLAQVYGAYAWANILLLVALLGVLRHNRQSAPAPQAERYQLVSLRPDAPVPADRQPALVPIK